MDSKEIKKRPTLEQIRSHMLHNETKEQSPTRIPGYFCAPTTNVVPRKGGPKEARLYRVRDMANLERDPLFDTYTPIRVSNVDPETATETVYEIFSRYGKIGNIFRPTSKSFSLVPAPYIFVRYVTKESADIAIREMNGKMIENRQIFVVTAEQDSFFTMDTGYITNEALDHPEVPKPPFDTTLSSSHYSHLRAEEIRDLDVTFNIRVDDIHPHITPEILRHVFSQFGEISTIYYPMDLKTKEYRKFAIIRYCTSDSALQAIADMHQTNLGIGRNILVAWQDSKSYWAENESTATYDDEDK